jgi:putative transposase
MNSDQGVQFCSDASRFLRRASHLETSGSHESNCWDNSVAQTFFSTFKEERIKKRICASREAALADIADYIDTLYSRLGRRSHRSRVSPE